MGIQTEISTTYKVKDKDEKIVCHFEVSNGTLYYWKRNAKKLTSSITLEQLSNLMVYFSDEDKLDLILDFLESTKGKKYEEIANIIEAISDYGIKTVNNKIDELDEDFDEFDDLDVIADSVVVDDLDETIDEQKPFYANLVKKKGAHPSIEIDIEIIPEQYQGDWTRVVIDITKQWIRENNFSNVGTVWMWTIPSANFQRRIGASSEFLIPMGFPIKYSNYLCSNLKTHFGKNVVRLSEYVQSSSEWCTLCHVENNKVWKESDPYTYELS